MSQPTNSKILQTSFGHGHAYNILIGHVNEASFF